MARDKGRIFSSERSRAESDALASFEASLKGGSRPSPRRERTAPLDAELPEVGPRLRQVIEASAVPVAPVVRRPVAPRAPRPPEEPSESLFSRFALPGCAALALAGTLATGVVAYSVASFSDPSPRETNGWYKPSPEPKPTPKPDFTPTPDLAPELAPSVEPASEVPTAAPEASAEVIELTDANFDSFIENAKGPVVVDFYATWCGPCKLLSPKLDKAASTYAGKITFVRVDVDKCNKTQAKFNIEAMPTMVVIQGGKEVNRLRGLPPDAKLKAFLDSLIK